MGHHIGCGSIDGRLGVSMWRNYKLQFFTLFCISPLFDHSCSTIFIELNWNCNWKIKKHATNYVCNLFLCIQNTWKPNIKLGSVAQEAKSSKKIALSVDRNTNCRGCRWRRRPSIWSTVYFGKRPVGSVSQLDAMLEFFFNEERQLELDSNLERLAIVSWAIPQGVGYDLFPAVVCRSVLLHRFLLRLSILIEDANCLELRCLSNFQLELSTSEPLLPIRDVNELADFDKTEFLSKRTRGKCLKIKFQRYFIKVQGKKENDQK